MKRGVVLMVRVNVVHMYVNSTKNKKIHSSF